MKQSLKFKLPLWIQWILLVLSCILLMLPALYNGYPLVYPDTGTYIDSGHSGEVPFASPLIYGLFVRHISLSASLWIVVAFQAMMTAVMLVLLAAYFWKDSYVYKSIFLIIFIGLATAASNFISQIMPDFLTSLMIMGMALFLMYFERSKIVVVLMGILIVFANSAHLSNPLVSTLIVLVLFLISLFRKNDLISYKKLLYLSLVIVTCWIFIPAFNYLNGAGFIISKTNNIRIMGRLIETGVLSDYLDEHCGEKNYPICKYRDQFPMSSDYFLWHSSPLYDNAKKDVPCDSVWIAKNIEYKPLIKDILSSPEYLLKITRVSFFGMLKQLSNIEAEPLPPMMEGSPVLPQIEWRYPEELAQYKASRQAAIKQTFPLFSMVQVISVLVSIAGILLVVIIGKFRKKISKDYFILLWVILAGTIINAWACPLFSTPAVRYQSRIAWLIPLLFILLIIKLTGNRKKKET